MSTRMNFRNLYENSSKQIQEAIIHMWEEFSPKMIELYGEQLKTILKDNISENIVVEDMSQWKAAENDDDWRSVVNPLIWRRWKKGLPKNDENNIIDMPNRPFDHQYKSWKTLLKDGKSIVVTSGTGSGKTECFMVPLIHDLSKDLQQDECRNAVEAIFLYPLNALMEDQRERMSDYIRFSEKKLQFAVYNGNTPEHESDVDKDALFYNEIGSRESIRNNKPNILFTNPSMLEYMLLRDKDQGLFSDSLKWIVIDEAHTFSGSAGAELALLLRRVLQACGKKPNEIKFATSSATIGNDDNKLKQFIADITGQEAQDIEIVKGERTTPQSLEDNKAKLLHDNNFVLLNQLFPSGSTIEKLANIDGLCDENLKVRLHYFIKCLTGGLYVDPAKLTDNQCFRLLSSIPLVEGKLDSAPLNAYYCSECGAIVGMGVLGEDGHYTRDIKALSTLDDDDIDDVDDDGNDDGDNASSVIDTDKFFIGIYGGSPRGLRANVAGNVLTNTPVGKFVYSKIKKDNICECPCCGAKGKKKSSPFHSFHMSADFIGRLIAPRLLEQTQEHPDVATNPYLPSQGRKYITFADSRQSVAGPTLKQNIETEEVWVTSVLYKKLLERNKSNENYNRYIELDQKRPQLTIEEWCEYTNLLKEGVNQSVAAYITWQEALEALLVDRNCDSMYLAFATNKKEVSKDLLKRKYVLSALYRTMNKRPGHGKNSPENWGLLCTCYPAIESVKTRSLPPEVEAFNRLVPNDLNKLEGKDLQDLIKLFIDYNIRSHQSLFFKLYEMKNGEEYNSEWKEIDIDDIRDYRTEEGLRRQITKPKIANNKYVMLLCRLLGRDTIKDLLPVERMAVEGVIDCLWNLLGELEIAEVSKKINWKWNDDDNKYKYDGWVNGCATDIYMNLSRIAFKLYNTEVLFDDHLKIPLDTTLKNFSPYPGKDGKYNIVCSEKRWERFTTTDNAREWFEAKRTDILNRWTAKLERILDCIKSEYNTLYIQAEHTAQVARSIIKEKTEKFKKGELNIMACSTTMEMGVDLGDLELVVMNNVPPLPANYKQRAGRAGRGDQNKSASVTLCGGDSTGQCLLDNPLDGFIQCPVIPPKIGLESASHQLVQRHINSMLLREFFKEEYRTGIYIGRDGEQDLGLKVATFFTSYDLDNEDNRNTNKNFIKVFVSVGNSIVTIFPSDYQSLFNAAAHSNSPYSHFLTTLDSWITNLGSAVNDSDRKKSEEIKEKIQKLVKNTSLEHNDVISIIGNTKNSISSIAKDIDDELIAIAGQWQDNYRNGGCPTKDGALLYWQFADVLNRNFMTHLSKHQFTPNANMPVGIVEMVLKENTGYWDKTENPTRDLRTALSEYAPGRLVFVDGRTYRIGGVKWNKLSPVQEIRHCEHKHTWLSAAMGQCPICSNNSVEWPHFGKILKMITPTGYYPSADVSRITQKEALNAEIGVELIGVGKWEENQSHRLYTCRTNEDLYNSHILYYDKGLGFGYHICKECGYAVPAPCRWDGQEESIIKLMYEETTNTQGRRFWKHSYRVNCEMDEANPLANILTNIVLGGSIQTDYCEVALFDSGMQVSRMSANERNKRIVTTLGILLCNRLSQKIGFSRGELDFLVREQDDELSLCIFDVAKGGSGRAKLLPSLVAELFDGARDLLERCERIEQLLDRSTMRYAEYVDIKGTKEWLEREYASRVAIPEGFPSKTYCSSYSEIEDSVHQVNAENVFLFVNNDFEQWNYRCGKNYPCWLNVRSGIMPRGASKCNLVVINAPDIVPAEYFPFPEAMNLKTMVWDNDAYKPLAMVGDTLYVTNKDDYMQFNEKWAADCVWKCEAGDIAEKISDWLPAKDTDKMQEIEIPCYFKTSTKSLIDEFDIDAFNKFIESAQGRSLTIEYSDRFLCSQLGMIITHQLIMSIIEKVKCKKYSLKYRLNISPGPEENNRVAVGDANRYLNSSIYAVKLVDFMEWLLQDEIRDSGENEIKVEGCKWKDMNHDRSLKIVSDCGHVLIIRPDGGFARGWSVDGHSSNGVVYDTTNCTITTDIPIYSKPQDGRYLYYVIYKCPR